MLRSPRGRTRGALGASLALGWVVTLPVGVVLGALVGAGVADASARTEPFEGLGEAPHARGKPARREALARARAAALEAAIEAIGAVDAGARGRVMGQVSGWTGGYRILSEEDDGARVQVRVEVELDLARLRKQLVVSTPSGARALVLDELELRGPCAELDRDALRARLVQRGLVDRQGAGVATPGRRLQLSIRCEDAGAVPFTFVQAARVALTARIDGAERPLELRLHGYGDDEVAARAAAVGRALEQLEERLSSEARGGVTLRVAGSWPAARIRRLEARIEQAVVGVDRVALDGIEADGRIRLWLDTGLDAAALEPRLRALDLQGFQVAGIGVDSPHALHLRLE